MPLISQRDALNILEPHLHGLFQVATTPWDQYHALVPQELLVAFGRRTRASGIHDLMIHEATRFSMVTDGARMFERNLMKGIVLHDLLAIRFKKLDEESLSRGHYTQQVEEYRKQCQLDGIDAVHHLELGYVLNDNETEIADVRLVCPSGRGVAWWARIKDSGIQPVVFDLFPPPPSTPPSDGGAVVKAKDKGVVIPIRGKADED